MTNLRKENLKEVLSQQSTSYDFNDMLEFIILKIEEYGGDWYIDEYGNLYAEKGELKEGESYPCVVCHTDTVHSIYKGFEVLETDGKYFAIDNTTMTQVGVGGDDKVGIFVALECLKKFDTIKVGFFAQEEIGCVGSSQADKLWLSDVGYIFECDRQGINDFVDESSGTVMFGKEFETIIKSTLEDYNRKVTSGGLTDVHELSQIANVCCANMSCGYYNPHSSKEYVVISEALETLSLVEDLIILLGNTKHSHEAKSTYLGYGGYYNSYGAYGYQTTKTISKPKTNPTKGSWSKSESRWCDECGAYKDENNVCDFCDRVQNFIETEAKNTIPDKLCGCTHKMDIGYNHHSGHYYHCSHCGWFEDITLVS